MSNRNEWRFGFTAEHLRDAADRMVAYHEGRLEHWRLRYEEAVIEAEHATVHVVQRDVTGGKQATVELDQGPARDLNLAQQKVKAHGDAAADFTRWRRAFDTQVREDAKAHETTVTRQGVTLVVGPQFELDPDDVAYFGINDPRYDA